MARPSTVKGSKFLIRLGDGEEVETFAAPCALTTKGIDFAAETNDFNVPDCDDPDAPTWTERVISALSAGVSGSGTLAMESKSIWEAWFLSGLEKNIQVAIDIPEASGGGYYSMSAVLTAFNIGANQGELATIEVTIQSNGEVVWNDLAAPTNTLLPSISGVAQEDEVLTAVPGVWTGNPTFTYQWQEDDSGWGNISGATGKTYTPVTGNVGNQLRVVVTGTNSEGSASATSAATDAVIGA